MREVPGSIPGAAHSPTRSRGAAATSLGVGDGAQLICHGLRRRCAPMCICSAHVAGRPATPKALRMCTWPVSQHTGRGESGWCSDMTSTHGVWRHAGVRFLLSGGRWPKPPSVRQSSWVKPASRSEPKATRSMAMEIRCQCFQHSWVSEAHMAAWSSGMILA